MKFNLKCNTNCHDHIDYRFPITPNQVDFRTTSHISHDYFHPISQDWERVSRREKYLFRRGFFIHDYSKKII